MSFPLGPGITTTDGSMHQTIAEILSTQPEVKSCYEYNSVRGLGREIKHGNFSFCSAGKIDKLKKVEHKIFAVLFQRT